MSCWDCVTLVERGLFAVNVEVSLGSFVHWHVISCSMANIVLSWPDDLVLRIVEELIPVRKPANCPWNHEEDWEHISWESQSFVDNATVEIYIGVKFSLNEVGVTKSNLFKFNSNFDQFLLSYNFKDFFSYLLDQCSSWVIVFVHSMAKTVEKTFSVLDWFNKLGDIFLLSNWLKHSQNCFVGSSMLRTIKGSSCSSNSSVDVNSWWGKMPDSCSWAVELVLGMKNK